MYVTESEVIKSLKKEIETLKVNISQLVLERDNLIFVECKNIENNYMLLVGHLEYKVHELYCETLKRKRKIELIQSYVNRQEKIDSNVIEKVLEDEFIEYQEKLEEKLKAINKAMDWKKSSFLTDYEYSELKKLYYVIVKELHPDLHNDLSKEKIQLFHNAVRAYENGDLDSLRIIHTMIEKKIVEFDILNSYDILSKEKLRLINIETTLELKIKEIKNQYPYELKDLIDDEDSIANIKLELTETIDSLNETIMALNQRIEELLEVNNG